MASKTKLLRGVKDVLASRFFSDQQIEKVIPRLQKEIIEEPKYLAEIIDTWNIVMNNAAIYTKPDIRSIPPLAIAPKGCSFGSAKVNMTTILADIEPDLLLLDPDKLMHRYTRLLGLGLTKNKAEEWLLLFNAPRGFYLQDWVELTKKVYYIEQHIIDFLFDKREQQAMEVHPLVRSAASVENSFDHIRTRYMFALRSGYKSLSHLYSVQSALSRPTLGDIILADNDSFLKKFAPYCSFEEYAAFSNLLKNHDFDDDDAQIFDKLAELNSLDHRE